MTTISEQRRTPIVRAVLRTALAVAFGALTIAFLVAPAWIEGTTGAEPDRGSGALELLLVLVAGVATVAASVGAGRSWRRVLTAGG